ncbi:hypothetical protein [Pedococcus bigeumensis]|uniref:Uncharacterized protein n=1 Tax=Pedococcus bigeumensis TaxID=433644 RepID=A0A502D2F1_9MICO|nr:hypothetical protein [Pedococcus bigeumensis]TPG19253.1 hypothetical protein EAH86_01760 [Pedococcus bigeumensis]
MTPHRLAVGLLASVTLLVTAVIGADAASAVPTVVSATTADDATGTYYPLASTRLLDTRTTNGGHNSPLGAGTANTFDLAVGGRGGVPAADVSAVVLNVTGIGPTRATHLRIYPAGQTLPTASTLNLPLGGTRANLVTVPLGTGGKVSVYNDAGLVNVAVDVLGYYAASDAIRPTKGMGHQFYLVDPTRIFDSRTDGGALFPGEEVVLGADFDEVTNPTVRALAMNITVVTPTAPGYVVAWNGALPVPTASNLNFVKGQVVPNMAIVPTQPDPNDGVPLFTFKNASKGTTHVLIDIVGVYEAGQPTGLRYRPLPPTRILDTRNATGTVKSPLGAAETRSFTAPGSVAGDATWALVANTVAVAPTAATFLTVWEDDAAVPRPAASNLNASPGEVVANATITPMGAGNKYKIYNNKGLTNTVMDVTGSFEEFTPAAIAGAQKSLGADAAGTTVTVAHGPSAKVARGR